MYRCVRVARMSPEGFGQSKHKHLLSSSQITGNFCVVMFNCSFSCQTMCLLISTNKHLFIRVEYSTSSGFGPPCATIKAVFDPELDVFMAAAPSDTLPAEWKVSGAPALWHGRGENASPVEIGAKNSSDTSRNK